MTSAETPAAHAGTRRGCPCTLSSWSVPALGLDPGAGGAREVEQDPTFAWEGASAPRRMRGRARSLSWNRVALAEIREGFPEAGAAGLGGGETLQRCFKGRVRAKLWTENEGAGQRGVGGGCYWNGSSWG